MNELKQENDKVFRKVEKLGIYIKSTQEVFDELIKNNFTLANRDLFYINGKLEMKVIGLTIECNKIRIATINNNFVSTNTVNMSKFIEIELYTPKTWRSDIDGYINDLHTIDKGIYRHFKGQYYEVLDVAERTDKEEYMVYYKALYGNNKTYVRDLDEFISEVDKEKYPCATQKYRFERVRFEDVEKISDDYLKGIGVEKYPEDFYHIDDRFIPEYELTEKAKNISFKGIKGMYQDMLNSGIELTDEQKVLAEKVAEWFNNEDTNREMISGYARNNEHSLKPVIGDPNSGISTMKESIENHKNSESSDKSLYW